MNLLRLLKTIYVFDEQQGLVAILKQQADSKKLTISNSSIHFNKLKTFINQNGYTLL